MICRTDKNTGIELFTSSSSLPKEWNDFLPEHHFLKSTNLAVTETSALPDLSYCYLLIREKERVVATAYFQVLGLNKKHVNAEKIKTWQSYAWSVFTTMVKPKMLIAGHLFRHDISSFYWLPELTDFQAYQYYQQAIDYALKQSCAKAVLVKDVAQPLITYFQNYASKYLLLRNDISMQMQIDPEWQSMQDYEKALKHKYAQRYRKIKQAGTALEFRELSKEEVEKEQDTIFRLYENVTKHQQVRLGLLNRSFLPLLKRHYENELKVWGIYEEGKMIGFLSAWVKDEEFDMFYIGFDYQRNADLQLYFNILFYSIEQTIAHKKPTLILGRTALEAKARLGCKPHYLSTFLYIRSNFIRNRVLQIQERTFVNEGPWEERHPLKNS